MSDRQPTNPSADAIDARLRRLVADATADAPAAPEVADFTGVISAPVDLRDDARRRRWMAGGAMALTAAAAAVTFVVLDDEPIDTLVPATVPITDQATTSTAVTTTVLSTVAPSTVTPSSVVPSTQPVAPTPAPAEISPLLIGAGFEPVLPENYLLDYAVTSPAGGDSPYGFVRYLGDADEPAIELIIRDQPDSFLDTVRELGRQTWEVDGRTVYDDNQGEGCLPDYCSVGLQWNPTTNVSVAWVARSGAELGPEHSIDRLVEFVGLLYEEEPSVFRPVAIPIGPTISNRGIIVADQSGVIARDGFGEDLRLIDEPAFAAVGLPDGRVIAMTGTGRGLPGELLVVTPESDSIEQFWVDGVPTDGSVRIVPMDAAMVDGLSTLLYQAVTGSCSGGLDGTLECDGLLEVATIPDVDVATAVDRRVIRDLGSVWEAGVDASLRNGGDSLPDVNGVLHDLTVATPFFASLSDAPVLDLMMAFEPSYGETAVLITVDQDGYLVDYIGVPGGPDPGVIRVRDNVGDAEATVPVGGVLPITGSTREPGPVLDIAPNLLRQTTGWVGGTIWIETYEDATPSADPDLRVTTLFIEIDLDGNEVSRISTLQSADLGATLTTTNR